MIDQRAQPRRAQLSLAWETMYIILYIHSGPGRAAAAPQLRIEFMPFDHRLAIELEPRIMLPLLRGPPAN